MPFVRDYRDELNDLNEIVEINLFKIVSPDVEHLLP